MIASNASSAVEGHTQKSQAVLPLEVSRQLQLSMADYVTKTGIYQLLETVNRLDAKAGRTSHQIFMTKEHKMSRWIASPAAGSVGIEADATLKTLSQAL